MSFNNLLKEYYTKQSSIKDLEDDLIILKEKINNFLDSKSSENESISIKTSEYSVLRRTMNRETLSKSNCPKDIWDKYSNVNSCTILSVKKNGEKRRSRSSSKSR
jgi:cell division septum initiation protein DivIVA